MKANDVVKATSIILVSLISLVSTLTLFDGIPSMSLEGHNFDNFISNLKKQDAIGKVVSSPKN